MHGPEQRKAMLTSREAFSHHLKISQHNVLWRAGFAEPISPFGDVFLHAPNTLQGVTKIIGEIVETPDVRLVESVTRIGGKRILQMPYGQRVRIVARNSTSSFYIRHVPSATVRISSCYQVHLWCSKKYVFKRANPKKKNKY